VRSASRRVSPPHPPKHRIRKRRGLGAVGESSITSHPLRVYRAREVGCASGFRFATALLGSAPRWTRRTRRDQVDGGFDESTGSPPRQVSACSALRGTSIDRCSFASRYTDSRPDGYAEKGRSPDGQSERDLPVVRPPRSTLQGGSEGESRRHARHPGSSSRWGVATMGPLRDLEHVALGISEVGP
jgi:hypothetical protein